MSPSKDSKAKPVVLSGMQPTGQLHIGNYFGAIFQWLQIQDNYQCIFFVADLHSLTTNIYCQNPANLYENSLELLATYLSCGIKLHHDSFFTLQSQLKYHPYMQWILSCLCPMGRLSNMVQMKDKSKQYGEQLGIFTYPVLMASDILLYNPLYVPVGEDQKQHLELTSELAKKLNNLLQTSYFNLPQNMELSGELSKVMDLRHPEKKMSKSGNNSHGCIFLQDSADIIRNKIKKATTDSFPMPSSLEELINRPGVNNLICLYGGILGINKQKIIDEFANRPISTFKNQLIDAMVNLVTPIGGKIQQLLKDKYQLEQILFNGKIRAEALARSQIEIICNKLLGHSGL